jgi:hypothetical protein
VVCYPNVASVEGDTSGVISHGKVAEVRAIASFQLSHIIVVVICYPDIGTVKGQGKRATPYRKRAQDCAVACPRTFVTLSLKLFATQM